MNSLYPLNPLDLHHESSEVRITFVALKKVNQGKRVTSRLI